MKPFAVWILRGYKRWISPAFPPSCRYVPTCSEYAMEAVDRYGVGCGGSMALWRVLRCHPLASGGLDPVKDSFVDPTPSASSGQGLPQTAPKDRVPGELNCAFTDEEMSY
jgi:putative membrane protein insertion efficiency factor